MDAHLVTETSTSICFSQRDRPNAFPYDTKPGEKPYKMEIAWRNVFGFIYLHGTALYALTLSALSSTWIISEKTSTKLSHFFVIFIISPSQRYFLQQLELSESRRVHIDCGVTSRTRPTCRWGWCCCSSKPSLSRTASSNGSAIIACTISSVTPTLILTTPIEDFSSLISAGSCAKSIRTWKNTDRELTWATWSQTRCLSFKRSEFCYSSESWVSPLSVADITWSSCRSAASLYQLCCACILARTFSLLTASWSSATSFHSIAHGWLIPIRTFMAWNPSRSKCRLIGSKHNETWLNPIFRDIAPTDSAVIGILSFGEGEKLKFQLRRRQR